MRLPPLFEIIRLAFESVRCRQQTIPISSVFGHWTRKTTQIFSECIFFVRSQNICVLFGEMSRWHVQTASHPERRFTRRRQDRFAGDPLMSYDLELNRRRALVTGGTQGIGEAVVARLRK